VRAREKRRERERRGVRSRDGGRSRRFLCRGGVVCLVPRARRCSLPPRVIITIRITFLSMIPIRGGPLVHFPKAHHLKSAFGFDRLPHHFFRSDKDESKATERGLHLQRRRRRRRRRRRCYHHRDPARKGMKISFKKRLWK
jgi:hypothetical protein